MTARRTRVIFVVILLAGISLATFLALRAMGENMLYFYTPSQLATGESPPGQRIRIGGLVVTDSVKHGHQGLEVEFALTDNRHAIKVIHTGILPDLFREGQGIVALGQISPEGVFIADEVLAKHDENYMPPEVAESLKKMSLPPPYPQKNSQ